MNAAKLGNYKNYKIDETHLHTVYQRPLSETEELLRSYYDYFNYGSLTIQSLHETDHGGFDPMCNLKSLYLKDVFRRENKRIYVYGNVFIKDEYDPDIYLERAKKLYRMGVDGYKTLEGKPGYRKELGRSLADPVYDKMYAFIESVGLPLKIHMCDPKKYWGPKETMTEMALARGWWYGDGTYPGFEQIWDELYEVLHKFPKLRLCVAHFGYISFDIDRCIALLENYENTSFDLTPGAAMFASFTEKPLEWREFFVKYSTRIFFGTDLYNHLDGDDSMPMDQRYARTAGRYNQVRRMLEKESGETVSVASLGDFSPLCLSDDILENIYSKNTGAMLGEGRALDYSEILSEAVRIKGELEMGRYKALDPDKLPLFIDYADRIIAHFGG